MGPRPLAGSAAGGEGPVNWRAILGPPGRPGDLGTLGAYLVEGELGRGGMGIVFRAYDPALERRVALKVLRPDLAHPRPSRAWSREARAAAQLRHDHLVAVYAVVDPPEGLPYLVMEYLAGPTLGRLIEPGSGMEPGAHAGLIAPGRRRPGRGPRRRAGAPRHQARQHHDRLAHRPGQADGLRPGREEAGGESLTREDILAGTPTHMSPEQARGQPLDGRSDVYSLGVTLYECLTGEVPFRGTPHMVIRQVCEDEPRPPRRLNDRIPRDLETICLKAMAKEPAGRYPSARDLGDDLRRWLRGESIRARPPGPIGRLARWCRRNARLASMAAAVFGLLVTLSVVSSLDAARIAREQRQTLQGAPGRPRPLQPRPGDAQLAGARRQRQARQAPGHPAAEAATSSRRPAPAWRRSPAAPRPRAPCDRGTVVAYDQLGALLTDLGRTPEAIRAYERSRDLAAALVEAEPGSIQARRDLALAHDKLGDLARFNNDIPAAEAAFRQAVAIREELIRRHGQDTDVLRDMQVSSNKIGLIHLLRGDYAAALDQFRRSLGMLERYAPIYPSRTRVLTDYEYTYRQLGLACLMTDWKAGVEYSRKALEKAQAFVAAEPENLWFRKKLLIDYEQLGNGLLLLGDLAGAETNFRASLKACRDNLAAEPGDVENQRNVGLASGRLGFLERCRRDYDAARRLYAESLSISEAVAESDPGSPQKQADVLEKYGMFVDIAERAERYGEALEWEEKTRQRLDRLEREHRLGRPAIEEARRWPASFGRSTGPRPAGCDGMRHRPNRRPRPNCRRRCTTTGGSCTPRGWPGADAMPRPPPSLARSAPAIPIGSSCSAISPASSPSAPPPSHRASPTPRSPPTSDGFNNRISTRPAMPRKRSGCRPPRSSMS